MTDEAFIVFGIPGVPYSSVHIPISDDAAATAEAIERAIGVADFTAKKYRAKFPEAVENRPQAPQNRPQRPQGGGGGQRRPQQGGRGETRATKYQQIDGECDICGGPVGRYPRTGNMRSDKAVCLGTCKDGDYIHTAFWLDEDNGGDDDYDGGPDPDDLPF